MNSKTRALLVVAVFLGSGVAVYVANPGTTLNALVDAGIRADCNRREARCTFLVDGSYTERTTTVAACPNPDGGKMEIVATQNAVDRVFDIDSCRLIATATNFDPAEVPTAVTGTCACVRLDAGNCRQLDGGLNLGRNEMAPGQWVGSDCVTKSCGEVFGVRNWPTDCAL